MKIPLISPALLLAVPLKCFAFAEWQTTTITPDLSSSTFFENEHCSHAVENGVVYSAFVHDFNGRSRLCFTKKNLYQHPDDAPNSPLPFVVIDSADRIASVQIRHCVSSETTHLVYSKYNEPTGPGSVFLGQRLTHATHQSGSVVTETIVSNPFANSEYKVSLALKPETEGGPKLPAVAYQHVSVIGNTSSVYYTENDSPGNWSSSLVHTGTDIGNECHLTFDPAGNPAIAFTDTQNVAILLGVKSGNNPWFVDKPIQAGSDPGQAGPAFAIKQPSLWWDEFGYRIAYVRELGNLDFLGLYTFNTGALVGSIQDIDSVANIQASNEFISHPEIIRSSGRTVIVYSKRSFQNSKRHLSVARQSANSPFTIEELPLHQGTYAWQPKVSLDAHNYPIITWTAGAQRNVHAAFCPDFTDYDRDGTIFLHEQAFGMNPDQPDAHLLPRPTIVDYVIGEDPLPHFELAFKTDDTATVNFSTQVISSAHFHYTPLHSFNLLDWNSNPRNFSSSAYEDSPNVHVAQVRLNAPVSNPKLNKQFLRLEVFRR